MHRLVTDHVESASELVAIKLRKRVLRSIRMIVRRPRCDTCVSSITAAVMQILKITWSECCYLPVHYLSYIIVVVDKAHARSIRRD